MNDQPALPPFSGDNPTCAKCGYTGALTTWKPPAVERRLIVEDRLVNAEHLERRCERCDYRWAEATVERTKP